MGQGGEKFNRYINESVDESIKTKINTVLENDSELSHEEETEKLARAKEVLYDKFWKRHTANAHKMIMPPILPIH